MISPRIPIADAIIAIIYMTFTFDPIIPAIKRARPTTMRKKVKSYAQPSDGIQTENLTLSFKFASTFNSNEPSIKEHRPKNASPKLRTCPAFVI